MEKNWRWRYIRTMEHASKGFGERVSNNRAWVGLERT